MPPPACHLARSARLARLLTALFLFLLLLPVCAKGAGPLVLNTAARAPRSLPDGNGPQDRIVKEAFRRIGVQVSITIQPPERGLISANQGLIDGDCWRVAGHSEQYPNLVMVPEPVDLVQIKVFTRDPAMRISAWADLAPYNVAFINGWKILEGSVKSARSVEKVKDIDALFALLARDRVDAVRVDPAMGLDVVRHGKLVGIRVLEPPLTRQDMYIYLHKRHADLVPRLAEALRQMKRDGTILRLTKAGQPQAGQVEAGQ